MGHPGPARMHGSPPGEGRGAAGTSRGRWIGQDWGFPAAAEIGRNTCAAGCNSRPTFPTQTTPGLGGLGRRMARDRPATREATRVVLAKAAAAWLAAQNRGPADLDRPVHTGPETGPETGLGLGPGLGPWANPVGAYINAELDRPCLGGKGPGRQSFRGFRHLPQGAEVTLDSHMAIAGWWPPNYWIPPGVSQFRCARRNIFVLRNLGPRPAAVEITCPHSEIQRLGPSGGSASPRHSPDNRCRGQCRCRRLAVGTFASEVVVVKHRPDRTPSESRPPVSFRSSGPGSGVLVFYVFDH